MICAILGLAGHYATTANFGVVEPGRVYRAAQPKGNLQALLTDHRIATVLNLRGGSQADPWYADEVAITRQMGVDFYDLPLNAKRRPSRRELRSLLDVLARCKYPLLIHCKSGADRTGLASGLYLLTERGESPEKALEAFTISHWHIPLGGPETLHAPFTEYAAWLKTSGLEHTPARFRDWVDHEYRADDALAELTPLQPGPRIRR